MAAADARGGASTGNRTYWAVFFGRRALVSLQLPYWRALHERGLVDEVHLRQYTRTASDKAWLDKQQPLLEIY